MMKQIIPFQKELLFNTKISEITSISLDHSLSLTSDDMISGEFHLFGDYKMTEGSINRESFDFRLPFDIALDSKYDVNSVAIDIDNFCYEIVNNESLKVSIDVSVISEDIVMDEENEALSEDERIVEDGVKPTVVMDEVDDIEESVQYKKADSYYLEEDDKNSVDFNIFENVDDADTYVTYHVYVVKESDTLDGIIEKFGVSREDISLYNDIDDIKPGTKLIIPNE